MKSILLCLLISLSSNLLANDNVRMTNPTNLQIYGTTNNASGTYLLNSVNPTDGNGLSETAAALVFAPISNTADPTHDLYFSLYHAGFRPFSTKDQTYSYISFPLTVNASVTQYLYVAVSDGANSNYKIVRKSPPPSFTTPTNTTFNLRLFDMCAIATTSCTNLDPTLQLPPVTGQIVKVYFFITTNGGHADGDPVTLTNAGDGDGGVFFQTKLSNKVYKTTDTSIFLTTPLTKGDGRVIANYSISNPISTDAFDRVVVFFHASAANAGALPIFPAPNLAVGDPSLYGPTYPNASLIDQSYSTSQTDSTITINNLGFNNPLVNSTAYMLSIGLMDKYKFVSNLSNAGVGTPTQIQELLKKQACYILTAGFGEEHYITNYFRAYRDHVLANSWLGRKFIRFYYRTAPHYALIIYRSETLRLIVRGFAYSVYFIFNYGIFVLIFLGSCYFLNILRKNKIFLKNNRL